MRHFRSIAGLLSLSLMLTVVFGDFFHYQNKVGIGESMHLTAHIDSTDSHVSSETHNSGAKEGECHINSAEVAIASHAGQRLVATEAVGAMPVFFVSSNGSDAEEYNTRTRKAPLFEQATLFATTISMRV